MSHLSLPPSLYADTINKVFDVLEDERQDGNSLDYMLHTYFGEAIDFVTTLTHPYMWIHLDNPAAQESWKAAQDIRESIFTVLVKIEDYMKNEKRPYGITGDPGSRGILTMAADVMNVLENRRADILAANGKIIDYNLTLRDTIPTGDRTLGAVIVCVFKDRFQKGDR